MSNKQTSMPTRKSLLIGSAVVILLLGVAGLHWRQSTHLHDKITPLEKGLAYEKTHLQTIPPYERLFFDYLERKYGIDSHFSAYNTPILNPTKESGVDPRQFAALRRIAYPNDLVNTVPDASGDTMSQMLMEAANCDYIPLSEGFGALVNQNIKAGNYYVTHAALVLHFMADNGCTYFNSAQRQQLQQTVGAEMDKLTKNPATKSDLRYEAITFLLDMGRKDLVSPSELSQIAQEQLPNGGWSGDVNGTTANDHSTVLALWALLAYSQPDAPNEPMIRHPSS